MSLLLQGLRGNQNLLWHREIFHVRLSSRHNVPQSRFAGRSNLLLVRSPGGLKQKYPTFVKQKEKKDRGELLARTSRLEALARSPSAAPLDTSWFVRDA